jgi:hypothetical protein
MIVNTPDGPVNFPDSMGADDIQNVLRQKYGFQGGGQGGPAPAGPAAGAPAPSPAATSAPISPSAPGGVGQKGGGGWFTGGEQPAWLNQNASPSLGQMGALDPAAANSSWNDFLTAHLAEAGKGVGQIGQSADDMVRSATNTVLPGDKFASYMSNLTGVGGGDLAAQKAATAAANAR